MKYVKCIAILITLGLCAQSPLVAMKRKGNPEESAHKRARREAVQDQAPVQGHDAEQQPLQDPSIPPANGDCYIFDYNQTQTNPTLPLEVLAHVLSYVPVPELLGLSHHVCATVNNAIPQAIDQAPYPCEVTCTHLKALTNLVSNGSHFIQATLAAEQGMQSNNVNVQCCALRLFIALVQQVHAFDVATKAAVQRMQSNHVYVQCCTLGLFQALVKQEHAVDVATQVAIQSMQSNHVYVQSYALELFIALVQQGHAFEQATQAAIQGMQSDNLDVREAARDLQQALQEAQMANNQ